MSLINTEYYITGRVTKRVCFRTVVLGTLSVGLLCSSIESPIEEDADVSTVLLQSISCFVRYSPSISIGSTIHFNGAGDNRWKEDSSVIADSKVFCFGKPSNEMLFM